MPQLKEPHKVDSTPKPRASWYAQGLSDGLGDRLLMFDNSNAPSLELLRFRRDFAHVPGFESALREQVHRLSQFRHPAFAPIRSVQRLDPDDDLALISNYTQGKRLSEVLHHARGPEYAAALIKQLAPALVQLQQHDTGISHGVLNPDRIVVSPEGRLTIVEHVVGPAIDSLYLRPAQLTSAGIALPPAIHGATARLDVATDWYQLGLVALSVLIGRPVTASELPQLEALLDSPGLSPVLRRWLDRALQISGTRIESGADARAALDELVHKEKPRDSRRIESPRHEQAAPPSSARGSDLRDDLPREVDEAAPTVARTTRRFSGGSEPRLRLIETYPQEQTAARPPTFEPSTFEIRPPTDEDQPSPQVRTLFEQYSTPDKHRIDSRRDAPAHDPPAATRPRPRAARQTSISTALVAALSLIAAVEAGFIVWLARPVAVAPQSPIAVESTASGENVLLSRGATQVPPLRLTVAPDLRWVRVTSGTPAAGVGGKLAQTATGTIRISSPIELKIFEQSRLLGSVPGADLKLPAGRHDIELVNLALGYRLRQTVEVGAGQSLSIHVAPPHGSVTIDASPWAEVSIDGRVVGRTPLGPLPMALGEHEITFRHPAGTKDRQRVTVKSETSTRVVGVLR